MIINFIIWTRNSSVGGLKKGEEQPNTAAKVRLWMIVSCHRSYTMATLSTATRHKVVILHQQGLSQTKILKQTAVSKCAVQAHLKNHKETGNVEDCRCSGRPRNLTQQMINTPAYFPSKSEDAQLYCQLRTGRNQWDPFTPIPSSMYVNEWPQI